MIAFPTPCHLPTCQLTFAYRVVPTGHTSSITRISPATATSSTTLPHASGGGDGALPAVAVDNHHTAAAHTAAAVGVHVSCGLCTRPRVYFP